MSEPFLTTAPAGEDLDPRVAVEIAWGADLADADGSGWTWTDITGDVVMGDADVGGASGMGGMGGMGGMAGAGITITVGRADYVSETQPAELTCTLDNRDSAYSLGSSSPNYPNVRRGTPVRVRVSIDGGSTWKTRFQGQVTGFTPQWDPETGRWATVTLSASGPLRRITQHTQPIASAMYTGTMSDPTVRAYWPLEDKQQATFARRAIGQSGDVENFQTAIRVGNNYVTIDAPTGEFASYTNVPSSAPMMTARDNSEFVFSINPETTASTATLSVICGAIFDMDVGKYPWAGVGTDPQGCLFSVWTEDGARVKRWDVCWVGEYNGSSYTGRPGNVVWLRCASDASEGQQLDPEYEDLLFVDNLFPGVDYEVGLRLSQSGSTTNWTLFFNPCYPVPGVDRFSIGGSVSSNSNGARITGGWLATFNTSGGLALGHLVIRSGASLWHGQDWMRGHLGENVTTRLQRLGSENGVHVDIVGSNGSGITATMGPQYYDSLIAHLRECEATGEGYLFDGLGPGLTYVTRSQRISNANGSAVLTLDASQGHITEPFAPVDDDLQTINECSVSRRGGTTETYADEDGPMGTEAIGVYSTSITVNPASDDNLVQYAQAMVKRGTVEGYRYPSVSFALEMHPELIDDWLDCMPQSKVAVTNITSIRRQHPSGTINLLIEGWTEEITAFTWRVTANTSLAARWAS